MSQKTIKYALRCSCGFFLEDDDHFASKEVEDAVLFDTLQDVGAKLAEGHKCFFGYEGIPVKVIVETTPDTFEVSHTDMTKRGPNDTFGFKHLCGGFISVLRKFNKSYTADYTAKGGGEPSALKCATAAEALANLLRWTHDGGTPPCVELVRFTRVKGKTTYTVESMS